MTLKYDLEIELNIKFSVIYLCNGIDTSIIFDQIFQGKINKFTTSTSVKEHISPKRSKGRGT